MNWRLLHAYSKRDSNQDSDVPSNVFNAVALLSEVEKDEIDADSKIVRRAHSALDVARAVTANRNDLLSLIVEIGTTFLDDPQAFNDGFDEPLAELSRRLLNLCASFRSYLEHQETHLKRETGRNSSDWADWRGFLTEIERENKYYSLIYGLRNYIQHVDMPPLHLNLHSGDPETVTLSVGLVRKDLLAPTAQWSSEMRAFIGSLDGHISLWDALKGWDEAFQLIVQRGANFRVRPARLAAERLLNVRRKYSVPDYGMIGIAPEPVRPDDGRLTFTIRWIEESAAATVVELTGETVGASGAEST